MKLFQRIFATFCMVIILAIFVASFSFWLVQERIAQSQFNQRRNMEISLLANAFSTFQSQGEQATRELLQRWGNHPASRNVLIITGDNKRELLGRNVSNSELEKAYSYARTHPDSNLAILYYDPFGEEYLFFIHNFDNEQIERLPTLMIPGLSIAPIWHEFIVFASILTIGLLLAYIVANNITQPIRILEHGMNRLAKGELDARVSQQLDDRKDELANLGVQFDKMAAQLQILVEKERHLLHHVSHEMRSPLARIQAIVGLLQARPEKQAEYIARLEGELTRMDNLVGEFLTLSRLETANIPMEKEAIALLPFITQIVEDSQAVAEQHQHQVSFEASKLNTKTRILGNESYLYRAFDNVIRNAMKYSPNGSTIQVRAYEDRKHVHIEIVDNGMGIKPDQLPHIFTAFYRADSSNGKDGTGLGLAITKHIAQQHNAKLIAENVSPNGLKMHFIFPKCVKNPQTE
ncbi:HAMP domain-containing sensor histidine kinase [Kingella kingae]|uniref:sensor histidine kinase n=1 Tax=Kingella kingae TaxID=504 RepID=UPI00254BFDFE|nr:HAMP domain-containing sensor histidine kinase [Kingella kingae]MDK4612878.1 HAMP domain-containing sensor histidine kinase [Kingella kingae]